MPKKTHNYETCAGKKRFASRASAMTGLSGLLHHIKIGEVQANEKNGRLGVYKCAGCKQWNIGHSNPKCERESRDIYVFGVKVKKFTSDDPVSPEFRKHVTECLLNTGMDSWDIDTYRDLVSRYTEKHVESHANWQTMLRVLRNALPEKWCMIRAHVTASVYTEYHEEER